MRRFIALTTIGWLISSLAAFAAESGELAQLTAAFERHSGTKLVFEASQLPPGVYYDRMPTLTAPRQLEAARIVYREVQKLPSGMLGATGLKSIGIFEACISRQGDGFRPYDESVKGYRYFGVYNGRDAVAAAFYSAEQLPLTFHHETFHHLEAKAGMPRPLADALSGAAKLTALRIEPADVTQLKRIATGTVLRDAVSEYAAKNPGEDTAETARHVMSTLPDSLLQATQQPALAGSQRILYVLEVYRRSLAGQGPDAAWFVNVALGRPNRPPPSSGPANSAPQLTQQLREFARNPDRAKRLAPVDVRRLLTEAETVSAAALPADARIALIEAASLATQQLLRTRIEPRDGDRVFTVPGHEDATGVNWTLRSEVAEIGGDAQRLGRITARSAERVDVATRTQLQDLRLLARFYLYINQNWQVTAATRQSFESALRQFADALPREREQLTGSVTALNWSSLAQSIEADGTWRQNAYLKNVDALIKDEPLRAAIRAVQPACVQVGNGSGVNIAPQGYLLTAGHCAGRLQAKIPVKFPDGRSYTATCIAIDERLDLALCQVKAAGDLPYASMALKPPREGAAVVCIGQPGPNTPDGAPTGYHPFHVSQGKIRGFLPDPLGDQSLGRTKHDAWTYWGHSGSPLFDDDGRIVALHNSWDSTTAMRHAVTQQAIVAFLKTSGFSSLTSAP